MQCSLNMVDLLFVMDPGKEENYRPMSGTSSPYTFSAPFLTFISGLESILYIQQPAQPGLHLPHSPTQYGITGYGVFKTGIQNWKGFCIKINCSQMKLMNFENWTNGEPQYLAKIRVFKVDYFILPLFLVPKLKSVTQNEWKKHPYIIFLLLVQK